MADEVLRLYGPDELGADGYPIMWHRGEYPVPMMGNETDAPPDPSIKEWIRELAGWRCERCGHPYPPGIALEHPKGEWTPCDDSCDHGGPIRYRFADEPWCDFGTLAANGWRDARATSLTGDVEALWRVLTTHHLNGVKWDCRWWNLAALCQRCHLHIQGKVVMEQVWPHEHTEWFKPHAAGYYASAYLGLDLSRDETMERLEELLLLERSVGWAEA